MSERVLLMMDELEKDQVQFAAIAGATKSVVNQWISGGIKSIAPQYAYAIESRAGYSAKWVMLGEGPKKVGAPALSQLPAPIDGPRPAPNTTPGPDIQGRVPLISWVQAGHWSEIADNFAPGDAESWRDTTARVSKHAFALRIVGDSMEPRIPAGSVVIVEPALHADNGSIVVVRQNGDSEATIKRLVVEGGVHYLKPENPRYPIMAMSDDAVICGVAVKVELDLRSTSTPTNRGRLGDKPITSAGDEWDF